MYTGWALGPVAYGMKGHNMKPATPHQQMTALDTSGDTYWLEELALTNGDLFEAKVDVLSHSENWMQIRSNNLPVWINMASVVSLRIAAE